MYMCVRYRFLLCFYDFPIRFKHCSDDVVFYDFPIRFKHCSDDVVFFVFSILFYCSQILRLFDYFSCDFQRT